MADSRVNISRKSDGTWLLRVDGRVVAQFAGGYNAAAIDTQAEMLILSAQHVADAIGEKSLDFTMNPDNMEIIKRVGMKTPKLIKMVH